ncbi:MAG: carbohydrate binding family 9 domain-containing protein [Saprospiraceae bacterium]|nr:carbohydrate binding family 9 domain-containing protein [Saprospiraceae bacterium]
MKQLLSLLALLFLLLAKLTAQPPHTEIAKKQYYTQPAGPNDVELDGIPDEAAWDKVDWGGDFIQYQPTEGVAPHQSSMFKILYDDKFLLIAYRAFDTAPDSIVQRMSRRDEFPGDWMEINIDSYHDLRTAFSFTVSVSGVKGDEVVSDNGNNWDDSWNPVWYAKTHVDSLGWTAEIKIPFSQLRYGNQPEPVWGIQVMRRIFRKEERSTWQYIPQNSGGWVSNFGELHGLRHLPSRKQVELAPYVVAQTERFREEAGNPFADGSKSRISAGLDGKLAVTSDLILDYTINPDFGQVEADPGAVRLDGYEIFFQERRPFFIESRNLFDYRLTGSEAGGDYDSDLLFYSRRIGGAPHGYPELGKGEFADIPQKTSILGAAKFSGKTKKGWSVGLLESVTRQEMARIDHNGERRKELVEPLTNYCVGRVLKDFDKGNTIFGAVFTAVNRDNGLDWLHRSAYSGGFDFQHFWKNRWWYVKANGIFSRVEGSRKAILETQTGFVHLFQRSNAGYLGVDSTRTSLSGTGGTVRIGKTGGNPGSNGGIFKFESGVTWRSPELELNDIGFLLSSDQINHFTWAGYQIQKPFSVFRNWRINYNHWVRWDFGGRLLFTGFNTNTHAWFKNNWSIGTGMNWNPLVISNNALRGGSSLRRPSLINNWAYVETDGRKTVSFSVNTYFAWGFEHTLRAQEYSFGVNVQPFDALRVGFYPSYSRSWRKQDQFVDQVDFGAQRRTIVSEVEERNFSVTARLTYNITPDLTVQYYAQPFIFRALYKNFGYVTDPLNKNFDDRFHRFEAQELLDAGDNYSVDESGDGVEDYRFGKPDQNYIQYRSNLVVRWEYVPGSEVYLVWSQGNVPNANADTGTPLVRSLFDNAFGQQPQNIFLVKFTYRFLL